MNEIQTIEIRAHQIRTKEDYLELLDKLRFMKECIKTAEAIVEAKGIEIINASGPIECGDKIYVVGEDKSYKPLLKPGEMAQKLLEDLGGDWEAFARCLAANAFKHGQTREELEASLLATSAAPSVSSGTVGEKPKRKFDEYFELVKKKFVDAKPAKKIKEINRAFVKPRKQLEKLQGV